MFIESKPVKQLLSADTGLVVGAHMCIYTEYYHYVTSIKEDTTTNEKI